MHCKIKNRDITHAHLEYNIRNIYKYRKMLQV